MEVKIDVDELCELKAAKKKLEGYSSKPCYDESFPAWAWPEWAWREAGDRVLQTLTGKKAFEKENTRLIVDLADKNKKLTKANEVLGKENAKLNKVNEVLGKEYSAVAFMIVRGRLEASEKENKRLIEANEIRSARIVELVEENAKLTKANKVLGKEYSVMAFMITEGRLEASEKENTSLKADLKFWKDRAIEYRFWTAADHFDGTPPSEREDNS